MVTVERRNSNLYTVGGNRRREFSIQVTRVVAARSGLEPVKTQRGGLEGTANACAQRNLYVAEAFLRD